jgi:acetyl-CoA carboxylase biotin carboxylase subunit
VTSGAIRSVLVANRGEIAVRIIRACREMGIRSIQVYSEADRDSLPVQLADQSVCIGSAGSAGSYLNVDRIVSAAVSFGADAIHPGYGFLSEKPSLAEKCQAAGVIFIGPRAETIHLMGNKIEAKRIARQVGVPVVPGSDDAVSSIAEAMKIAEKIGFPVLLKAASGGGGRGMRVVEEPSRLERSLAEAMGEASAAFGDPSIYIERYFTNLRHIEVQVLGDGEEVVHLGERDCSTQRRNQKLIEETPSPAASETLRKKMTEAALLLCRHVSYRNAGTIEFILDEDSGQFFFLEMNTRIQVEHPVTEMVTGIDLVKRQITIASDEGLGLRQDDIRFRGHAIECRINAEDHLDDFRPSPGCVASYLAPGGPGVRVDSYLRQGASVPPFYDSLLAKIVCWGEAREEAVRRMERALAEMSVDGVKTTIPFHRQLIASERFQSSRINTHFVQDILKSQKSMAGA